MLMSAAEGKGNGSIAVRTENLCRHFRMGESLIPAVDRLSLQIRAGDFVALLGASGSGKSTLLNLIAGLDRPTSGSVVVQGKDLAVLGREDLAKYRLRTVGMVFQSFYLIPSMTLPRSIAPNARIYVGRRSIECGWAPGRIIVRLSFPGESSSGLPWHVL
jgi:macrolide transport system ATP-binding/permease protein